MISGLVFFPRIRAISARRAPEVKLSVMDLILARLSESRRNEIDQIVALAAWRARKWTARRS
jgi:hypothetical protein